MPRSQPLHKATGGIALESFRGVNTNRGASKLEEGEFQALDNVTTRGRNAKKEHGWQVVNRRNLSSAGVDQSRCTTDKALFTGANAGPVTGVHAYRYSDGAGGLNSERIAVCGKEVYTNLDTSFEPDLAANQLHSFSGTGISGDLPCFAEWDGNLFFSIGRETTSAAWGVDAVQVYDGSTVQDFKTWWEAYAGVTFNGADVRPRWMAVQWGYLLLGDVYDKSNTQFTRNTLYLLNLNDTTTDPQTWTVNILGAGKDGGDGYINGIIGYGDHLFAFNRFNEITRLSYLTGINIEGIDISGVAVEDRTRRIAYRNGCAAGHGLVIAGKMLLWPTADGIWMLENPESLVPVRVSEDLDEGAGQTGLWSRINQTYIGGACAAYDEQLRQLLFSVPMDGATYNNKIIVGQLPENEYEAADFRTWRWSLRDRTAASLVWDDGSRSVLWGSSLSSGLVCEDGTSLTAAGPYTFTGGGVGMETTAFDDSFTNETEFA